MFTPSQKAGVRKVFHSHSFNLQAVADASSKNLKHELPQVLAAAVNALATAHEGVGRWSAAWSGNEGFSSPTEELVLSMHSPHAQASPFIPAIG